MRYRVAFTKRLQSDGTDAGMKPSSELDQNLADGVVAEKVFVESIETDAQHSQEELDEDDAFLGSASPEVWEYDVIDARAQEFEEAIQNSDLVMEWDIVDDSVTLAEEGTQRLPNDTVFPLDQAARGAKAAASAADGPAGRATGDESAGGLGSGSVPNDGEADSDLEELSVLNAGDPRLGLTNRDGKPAEDWAANTGPARNPSTKKNRKAS